ncbi:MAG: prepilin peptidase [Deltaproteobacteria bacterium]|nr:prepilin peptidase [Deltaproteobacteria bacterium]
METGGLPSWFWGGAAFVFGAFWGSFANVCIFRVPWGISIVWPSSRCPTCLSPIRAVDNVPVASWVLLGARCRDCGDRIAARYPLVELLVAFLSLALFMRSPSLSAYAVWFAFGASLVVLSFIDIDHWLLPDAITYPGIAAGLLFSLLQPVTPSGVASSPLDSLLGAALGGGLLWVVALAARLATGRLGFGGGDVKLMAMVGAFLGYKAILPVVFLSAAQGSVIGIALLFARRREPEAAGQRDGPIGKTGPGDEDDFVPTRHHMPFGPFVALGALEYLFFGPAIFDAITGLILKR